MNKLKQEINNDFIYFQGSKKILLPRIKTYSHK